MGGTLVPYVEDSSELVLSWVTSADEARLLKGWHTDPDAHPFLLVTAGTDVPVGYGELWVDVQENEAELARLIVASSLRGQGHGRRLVGLLTVEARRLGFVAIWLRVRPENAPAIACYRGAGFTRASEVEEAAFNIGQPCEYIWMRAAETSPAARSEVADGPGV